MKRIIYKTTTMLMPFLLSGVALAETSAPSSTISANPSISHFEAVALSEVSSEVTTQIKNIGSADLIINSLSLSGSHAGQFRISTDNCSMKTLQVNTSCDVGVTFVPDQQGNKQALLNIFSNSADTPTLQAFLTNYEDPNSEAARRLPPVLYSLNVPEKMVAGQAYTLEWSLLGYHDDYASSLAMFDCTGVTDNTCGANYDDSTRFFASGGLDDYEIAATNWQYDGLYAKEFKFKVPFTPSFAQQTNIVLRFYRRNNKDAEAGLGGLSLLIPGNLAENYYDKEGRRLQKTVTLP